MNRYDRTMLNLDIVLLLLGIANLGWAVAKAALSRWQLLPFSQATAGIAVTFAAGVFLVIFACRDLLRFKRYGSVKHGFDERNVKIIGNAWRNSTAVFTVLTYAVVMYYDLFHKRGEPVFSVRFMSYMFIPAFVVFVVSWLYYERSKKL